MNDSGPPVDGSNEADDRDAEEARRVWSRRRGVHRVAMLLRTLGWLAAAACLLAGVAAVVVWAWRSIV